MAQKDSGFYCQYHSCTNVWIVFETYLKYFHQFYIVLRIMIVLKKQKNNKTVVYRKLAGKPVKVAHTKTTQYTIHNAVCMMKEY